VRFQYRKPHKLIPAGLVLDLGNTRSFVVLVDDLRDAGGGGPRLDVRGLELQPRSQQPDTKHADGAGVFDSFLVLESPQRFNVDVSSNEHLSFVRMGSVVETIVRELAPDAQEQGRFSLSSPKRYFWQDDDDEIGWKMYKPTKKDPKKTRSGALDAPLANEFRKHENTSDRSRFLPESMLLSAAFVEIFEQAEQYLNSPEHLAESPLKEPRYIDCIYVTYPPGWSDAERDLYKKKLEHGLDAFCSLRALPKPTLDISCDEASAVLLSYVFFEIMKLGGFGQNWIRLTGRQTRQNLPSVRLAVIDLGGGTSDLVIADVEDYRAGQGVDLRVTRLYQDGFDVAGDELIRQLTEQVTLPALGNEICQNVDGGRFKEIFFEVLSEGNNHEKIARRAKWARNLWFPIGVELLQAIQQEKTEIELEKYSGVLPDFCDAVIETAKRQKLEDFYNHPGVRLTIPGGGIEKLEKICTRLFTPVARQFGAAIIGFDCDLVLVAGKTSEIHCVQKIFQDNIPLPGDKFVPLKDYPIGGQFTCPLAQSNCIADAKVTTVLGGAIYLLANEESPAIQTQFKVQSVGAPGIGIGDHFWGEVSMFNQRFSNEQAILGPHMPATTASLTMGGASIFLARRRYAIPQQKAQVAFEIRIRGDVRTQHGIPTAGAEVRVRRNTGGHGRQELEIESVSGRFQDGTELKPEHVELRHRIMMEDQFWVDSGKILSDDWN
jgi:hypothetical protein